MVWKNWEIDYWGLRVLPGSFSQPDVVIVSSEATNEEVGGDDGGEEPRRQRYLHRGTDTRRHHAQVYGRLSSSAGEVQIPHSDEDDEYSSNVLHGGGSLESTHSLTYLEWVHERQTRRMRTRSEWFLSPVLPAKHDGSSRLSAFECSASGMLRPHSQYDDSTMGSSEGRLTSPDNTDDYHLSPLRRPFLPKTSERVTSGSSASTSGHLPPLPQPSSSSSSSVSRVAAAGGVVRRRSWRMHYVRPNRSADNDDKEKESGEIVAVPSKSTPLYHRNIPHTYGRILPNSERSVILLPSSTEQQQQSVVSQKEQQSTISEICHETAKVTSHPKNVHL